MVVLEGIAKRYGRAAWVFQGIDLTVADGRLTVITGANGCGKSTLLRIVAGLLRPTAGRVRGRPRALGYLPGPLPGALGLSATAYLRHMGALRGITAGRTRERAGALLDRLGFAGDPDAPIRTLSKGNAQKVGLTQALLPEDGFLVLDEPWSGLDSAARLTLDTILAELAGDAPTALITDHTGHAERLSGGELLRLADGRLTPLAHRPTVLVELASCPAGAPERIATLPGVAGAHEHDELFTVTVAGEHSDAVLAEALRLGCSVRTVASRWSR